MASNNSSQHFPAFHSNDTFNLKNLLDQLLLPRRHLDMSDPPDFPIPPNTSRFTTTWLPEHPPVPPSARRVPLGQATSSLYDDNAGAQYSSSTHPTLNPRPMNLAPVSHARASDRHMGYSEYQPDRTTNEGSVGPALLPSSDSMAPQFFPGRSNPPPVDIPFLDSARRVVLPPISSFPIRHAVQLPRPTSVDPLPTMPLSFDHEVVAPLFAQPPRTNARLLDNGRSATTSAHQPSQSSIYDRRDQAVRAPSAASSYTSSVLPHDIHDERLAPSTASLTSTESLSTPNTSNFAQNVPWQARNHDNVDFSGQSGPSAPKNPRMGLPTSPIVDRAQFASSGSNQTTGLNSPSLQSPTRALAFSPHTTTPQTPVTTSANNTRVGVDTKISKSGGNPYVSPEERAAHVSRGAQRHYALYEYGLMIQFFFDQDMPVQRARDAMLPQSKGSYRDVFTLLSRDTFEGSRDPAWLYKHFKVLVGIYRAIRTFSDHFPLNFDFSDESALYQRLTDQLEGLQRRGINLSLKPWHLLIFVRESWYFRIHANLRDHPSMQTTTQFRSGAISPASAPSRLPTQSSAPSRVPVQPSVPPQAPAQLPTPLRAPSQSSASRAAAQLVSVNSPVHPSASARSTEQSQRQLEEQLTNSSQAAHNGPPSNASASLAPANTSARPSSTLADSTQQTQGPAEAPHASFFRPARSGPPSSASLPRNPSVSSLRIPRDPPSGRLARNTLSAGSLGESRARVPRSTTSSATPTGYTPSGSEASSVGPSHATDSLGHTSYPQHAEMVRNQRMYQADVLSLRSWQVEQAERSEWAKVEVAQRLQEVAQREAEQRMRLDEERMRLEKERAERQARIEEKRLQIEEKRLQLDTETAVGEQMSRQVSMMSNVWATQHGAFLNAATMLNSQHPLYDESNARLRETTARPILDFPFVQSARLSVSHMPLTLSSYNVPATPGAGPSNIGHLRNVSPSSNTQGQSERSPTEDVQMEQEATRAAGTWQTNTIEDEHGTDLDDDDIDDLYVRQ